MQRGRGVEIDEQNEDMKEEDHFRGDAQSADHRAPDVDLGG